MKTLLGALRDKGQFCCISELGVAAGRHHQAQILMVGYKLMTQGD